MCSNFPSSYLSNNMFLLQVLTPALKRKLFKQTQIYVVCSLAVNLCPIAHTRPDQYCGCAAGGGFSPSTGDPTTHLGLSLY